MSGPIVLGLRILLALALYAFLGWTLWTIWQDLKRAGQQATTQKIPAIRLEVQIKNQAVISRTFSQPEIILGRESTCDVLLDDATVSARHAKLNYHHGQWWVEDIGSTNGTTLNDEKLTIATVLATGDEIQCGNARVSINRGGMGTVSPTQSLPE
ncbi:MAG: FHA domain-containing protein [Chloroflexi bacterium]|nr:FHA domain-containing protein [Chloroflexota bacterium]